MNYNPRHSQRRGVSPGHRLAHSRNPFRTLIVLAMGAILVGTTASVASFGAYGTFSATGVATASVTVGSVTLVWNDTATAQLDTTVGPLNPNDSMQSVADLVNSGDIDLSTIQIAVVGTDTGPVSDGLQLAIDSCSVPWTGAAPSFTCVGGTERSVSADRPVTGLINLPASEALPAGGTHHLRFTYRLGSDAPTSMANTQGTVAVVATGIQRAGQTK
jgi:spore coat-associated protein N